MLEERMELLERIRKVADYQFERDVGKELFPDEVELEISKRTGRIRRIYLDGKILATVRAKDGLLALTIEGAKRLLKFAKKRSFRVVISDEAVEFVRGGRDVFAKYVVHADTEIRPGEEVVVTDQQDRVLAVGRALLTGEEMLCFSRGIAVKVRHGCGTRTLTEPEPHPCPV